uniref:Mitochondrial genome maintenance exonuclease 1 n=1 Tax=Ciona savignyi TaxID=51511 RepID=H2YXB3_CIOSA
MIAELGEEGFYKMQKETLAAGTSCHSLIEQCLKGTPMNDISPGENSVKLWQSVTSVLDEVNDMIATEHKVTHSYLGYSGYLDCIASYKGQTCLIDWKTSKKPKYKLQDCYDDPVQIAAYVGAYNSSSGVKNQIVNGVVVKIYHNGKPASAFQINDFMMQFYWRKWLERLALYHDIVSNNTNT